MVILGECKCLRQNAKQGVEWALDYRISSLRKEYREWQSLGEYARAEFKEITGKEPEGYRTVEKNIAHLSRELDFYLDLRKEIISLPRCDEPAFEVRE